MRKYFAFMLAVVLACVSSCAWAEGIYLSSVSSRTGYVGKDYHQQFSASGAYQSDSYSWSVSGLPSGLYDDDDYSLCHIYGTPRKAGKYTVWVSVSGEYRRRVYPYGWDDYEYISDSDSDYAILTIRPAVPKIITGSSDIEAGEYGKSYEAVIDAAVSEDEEPDAVVLLWEVASGDVPEGLSLDKDTGTISGTPSAAGEYAFRVTVSNMVKPEEGKEPDEDLISTAERVFTLTINEPEVSITTTTLPGGTAGTLYSAKLSVDIDGVTWSAEDLPEWLTLNADTGELSGTPAEAGEYTFIVTATVAGSSDEREYTITIAENQEDIPATDQATPGTTTPDTTTPDTTTTTPGSTTPSTPGDTTDTTTTTGENSDGGSSSGGCNSWFGIIGFALMLILKRSR